MSCVRRYRKLGGRIPGAEVETETAALEERLSNLSKALNVRQVRLGCTFSCTVTAPSRRAK